MKMKKFMVAFLALVMLATGSTGKDIQVQASTDKVIIAEDKELVVYPGQTTHVSIPIQSTGNYMPNPSIEISSTDTSFTFSKPTISMSGTLVSGIAAKVTTDLEFDVKVADTAAIKDYPISILFTYTDLYGNEGTTYTLSTKLTVKDEKTPAQLTISNVVLADSNIGSQTTLSFTVKNEGEITSKSTYLLIDYGGIIEEEYTAKNIKIGDLASGETKDISLPISILSSAGTGRKTLAGTFTYKTPNGTEKTSTYNIYINLSTNASAPKLTVSDVKFDNSFNPGEEFSLTVVLKNTGAGTAQSIKADVDDSTITTDGILRNYYSDGISVANMAKDKSKSIKIPLSVSEYAAGGMKNIKIVVTYTDSDGVAYSLTKSIYVNVVAATPTPTASPNLVISNVVQSPQKPVAGDKLEITFDLENKSSVDVSELKVYPDGLTNATFIPVDSQPYQYIEKLKAGDKVQIKIPLIVSTSITEGLNNLTIKYKYTGGDESSVIIPVHDIQNDSGSSSKPKLIISKYSTDTEELRAGKTFNFTYEIYNTNASVAAKNITVTITQADNIFTVTQGSNSFFINKINPGESVENTIEMKVKSDATTKVYPLKITIEYEYEGLEPNTETGETGVTKTEELNLQAVENARPVADNIQVYAWDGNVVVGGTATLSFEFYNMGKSTLSNVVATVEGDGFTKADGSMYFIGNVEAGNSTLVEFDVVPNIEGTASGTLKISYEDSNGDTIEFTKDFEGTVMAASTVDTGVTDGSAGEVMNPVVATAKKAILPLWAFIAAEIILFILFVPITKKVIISAYKSKLRKKEQEQY